MRDATLRIAGGIALVLLVTGLLAGAVATSAAVSIELSDGDSCETGGAGERTTPTPENVTAIAGNVTRCLGAGPDAGAVAGGAQTGGG